MRKRKIKIDLDEIYPSQPNRSAGTMSESFAIYRKQVNEKFKCISRDDETELFNQYINGNKKIRDKIVEYNLPFAMKVAISYQGQGVSIEDLIGAANIGLLVAIDRYNPKKGFKFISYAVWWIRRYILEEIHSQSRLFSLPANLSNIIYKVRRESNKFESKNKEKISNKDLSEMLDMPEKTIAIALNISDRHKSLDAMSDDYDTPWVECLPSIEEEQKDHYMISSITSAIESLRPIEQDIVKNRHGFNKDNYCYVLDYFADKYKLTRERIRQLEKNINRKLAHKLNKLKEFV